MHRVGEERANSKPRRDGKGREERTGEKEERGEGAKSKMDGVAKGVERERRGWQRGGEGRRGGRRNRVFVDSKWRLYYCTYILLPKDQHSGLGSRNEYTRGRCSTDSYPIPKLNSTFRHYESSKAVYSV